MPPSTATCPAFICQTATVPFDWFWNRMSLVPSWLKSPVPANVKPLGAVQTPLFDRNMSIVHQPSCEGSI